MQLKINGYFILKIKEISPKQKYSLSVMMYVIIPIPEAGDN
jgi:uncharacterized membrane protein